MPGLRPPKEDLIPQLPIETEQKVLKATVALTILGTLFLIIALATDYWLILSGWRGSLMTIHWRTILLKKPCFGVII